MAADFVESFEAVISDAWSLEANNQNSVLTYMTMLDDQKTMNQLFQLLGEFQRNDYIVFQNSTKSHNSSICSIVNHMPLSRSKRVRKNITECLRLILEGTLCCLDQEMKKEMIMKMGDQGYI